jgi:hypothetical protein
MTPRGLFRSSELVALNSLRLLNSRPTLLLLGNIDALPLFLLLTPSRLLNSSCLLCCCLRRRCSGSLFRSLTNA